MRTWEDDGQKRAWIEYKGDKKNGLVCLFKDDLPWMIQEYDKGRLLRVHMATFEGLPEPKLATYGTMAAATAQNKEAAEASLELAKIEERLDKGQEELATALSDWYRDEKKRQARELRSAGRDRRGVLAAQVQSYNKMQNEIRGWLELWSRGR